VNKHIRWVAAAGLALLILGAVDPLEGFPLVLTGGALAVAAARWSGNRRVLLMTWGLALAAAGCAAMVVMSLMGGIGGSTGRPMTWAVRLIPYPLGWLMLLAGAGPMAWSLRRAVP
jgi:hypothetical protein